MQRGDVSSSEDDGGDRLTTWTLGAIKERNLALEGYCQTEGCGHFYVFNVDNLISGMGADYVMAEYSSGFRLQGMRRSFEVQAGDDAARGLTLLFGGGRTEARQSPSAGHQDIRSRRLVSRR